MRDILGKSTLVQVSKGLSYQESTVFGCNNAVVLKLRLYTYTSNYLLLYNRRLGNLAPCESLFKV